MLNKHLSKTAPIPLYLQLAQLIENEINSGNLKHGDVLPTEREFCEAYEVSRITVREAVAVLKRKEIVETRRGSGNYVSKPDSVNRDLMGVHDFDLQIEASGHTNQIDLIEFDTDFKSAHIAHTLALDTNAPLIKVVRLRKTDNLPLFIETIYLSRKKFHSLTSDDFLSTRIFSKELREKYDIEINEITLILDPVLLKPEQAKILNVTELPAPGLMNERTSFDKNNSPVVFSEWLFSRHRCRHLLKIKTK